MKLTDQPALGEMTPDEVREAIEFWLSHRKEVTRVSDIYFHITDVYEDSDWQGRYPHPTMTRVTFKVDR